jgi:hypothetical protein
MRNERDHSVRRSLSIGCVVGAILVIWCVCSYALEREQETSYDFIKPQDIIKQDVQTGKRSTAFHTYCWRIMTAPLMVMFTFPFDEETNIYNTYLSYVNKNSDRRWRKKEHTLKKENLMGSEGESDAEKDMEQPTP